MKELLSKVSKELKPNEKVSSEIDAVIKNINALLKKAGVKAECVRGGSTAKGTFLKNDYDVDLFVRFDKKTRGNISDILEKSLKKEFKLERVHGSRDYFQIHNKLLFEIVPVRKISNYKEAKNVTDMSPLHVDYVKKKLQKNQADEIRLAKQFCKAAKVYGAESYIKGFSGHILDLLVIHYRSFEKLVRAAVDWKPKVVIDIEKHLKDPLKELDEAKIYAPLIIVDPIQPDRNAAAALSKEKFDRFVDSCKKFLLNPNKEFFKVKYIQKEKVARKVLPNEELFFFEITALKGKNDVIGAKIMKAYEYMKTSLKKYEFEIVKTDWEFKEKGIIYFILKKEKLSEKMIVRGPPINRKDGVQRFKAVHKKVFEKNKRLFAEEKRKYRTTSELIKVLLKDKYVKERVKKISKK